MLDTEDSECEEIDFSGLERDPRIPLQDGKSFYADFERVSNG